MGQRVVKGIPAATLALVVLTTMGALYGIDKFLAAQEQSELSQEAHNHYLEGQKFLHEAKAREAIADFARAHAIVRSNREYLLALAEAQLAARQFADCHETLSALLEEDSNDGRANLLMARVLAAEGRFKQADAYYHRAIYGEWPADWANEPRNVRMELARMLAEHGDNQELLSELLLLENSPAVDPAAEKQIAQMFIQAGSFERAADAYRHLEQQNPDDIEGPLGLANAEILAGNYPLAERAVLTALHHKPFDVGIQSQLRLVVRLATLDPTARRLTTAEKYRRSGKILQLVQDELNACIADPKPGPPEKPDGQVTNEKAEARLDEAENLWKQRKASCNQSPPPDDPLPILMRKLAQ